MPHFRKSVMLPASLKDVFDFHVNPANLKHIQPPGAKVIQADFPPRLNVGSKAHFLVACGPFHQHWSIVIESLTEPSSSGVGVMIDRATDSPFASWCHRHEFIQRETETQMTDEVEFTPPGGKWASLLELPTHFFLWVLFAYRHWSTRRYFQTNKGSST